MYRDLLGAMRRRKSRRSVCREKAALTRKLDSQALGEVGFPVAKPKKGSRTWF